MSEKQAFVFDTNFIIQNKDLNAVVTNLNEQFAVYVAQVSIDERISQQRLEVKQKFHELPQLISKYRGIASIKTTTTIEKEYERIKTGVQKNYTDLFVENIIPFSHIENSFSDILHRVHEKLPPFVSGESDRGFKDTLIWLSLIDFFEKQGESDVVFVTDDKGFRNNAEILCVEFNKRTRKTITIQDNSFYKTLLETNVEVDIKPVETQKLPPLPDVGVLREKVHEVINSICQYENYDGYNESWYSTFTLKKKVNIEDIKAMFSRLRIIIEENLFENELPPDLVISVGDSIDNEAAIPIRALQEALNLYEDIRDKMSDYLPQFFRATLTIINNRYNEIQPLTNDVDDDELPF